ncbi:signal peptide peptidase SppA [Alkalimonas collagenimarina]|uniref:Signal peptide peptidase SppA n=1 Tax=Alkalimonas collagenimarina TaxID=400390 RepID=A0ABT9GX30_9GAMM|nr:signal peptide peptidase SppA [Alkalimonas collagenimarina]MDP4535240.1 signal peptide peptidase SppA [Alkalimonas collagenimarina]
MSADNPGIISRFFGGIWRGYKVFRSIFWNVLFILLIIFLIVAFTSDKGGVEVPNRSALVLNLNGVLVEEQRFVDPFTTIINDSVGGQQEPAEILVTDVVKVIQHAATDQRIQSIVLDVSGLRGGSLDKLHAIGQALDEFKAQDKPIYTRGAFYSQNQYYLASYANEIHLDPMGAVILEGYGTFPMFYKSALEKLKINTHVFRVGTYKSAVEPFLRDDMSEEVKEVNLVWLQDLWSSYKASVGERRGFSVDTFIETYDAFYQQLVDAEGDMAQIALNTGMVDALTTQNEFRQMMIEHVGQNEQHTYNHVSFDDYRSLIIPKTQFDNPLTDKVAVVVARGMIIDGSAKAGTIGGDSTAAMLRRARHDDKVKAVVLRIDSGGGSAFASEIIGREITALREAGKPVIASMGAVAASGGYWIAAPANEIWASPTTITGSIGIFGLFHTLEDSFNALGLNVDGVGTTELAGLSGGLPLFKGLAAREKDIFQLMIERGYTEFLTMVANNRDMTIAEVDEVAQGRVFTGERALEYGLVDQLGGYDDAIAAAADLAGLTNYDVKVIGHQLSSFEQMIVDIFGGAANSGWLPQGMISPERAALNRVTKQLRHDFVTLSQFNDPQGMYAFCLVCMID